ncbi:hypothetical protein K1W54_38570 [Micromonospora sp. CPCC 205371]|nr:hypothetical protein [Micromonospora sp. CPCC 205371]
MSREPMPDAFGGQSGWAPQAPRSIAPTPAATREDLRGRRVIVGLPGYGWRGDLRADEKVVQGSRTYVPVIPEQEWYKAEAEQIEVFAPLVPVDRVWVEVLVSLDQPRADAVSRLVSLDAPPLRQPVPIADASWVTGRRVVQVVDGVERRDLRAVTEMYASADGDVCLRIATELEWYRWAWSGQSPRTLEISTHLLWLE